MNYWNRIEDMVIYGSAGLYGYARWLELLAASYDIMIGLLVIIGLGAKAYKEVHGIMVSRRKEKERQQDRMENERHRDRKEQERQNDRESDARNRA